MSQTRNIRFFFNKIPPSCMLGTTREDLVSRSAANYDAIQIWGKQGNSKAISKAGSGLIAICAWRAAKALAQDAQQEPFQKESGLNPRQFDLCDKELGLALHTSASLPSTPRKDRLSSHSSPASTSLSVMQQSTPAARLRSLMNRSDLGDIRSPLGRGSTGQSVRFRDVEDMNIEEPQTPTQRVTRNRTLLKETSIAEPSNDVQTSTETQNGNLTPLSAKTSTLAKRQIGEAIDNVTASPSSHVKNTKKRKRLILEYPGGEPLRVGGLEVFGEWDSRSSKEKVDRCIAAVQRAIDTEAWISNDTPGMMKIKL